MFLRSKRKIFIAVIVRKYFIEPRAKVIEYFVSYYIFNRYLNYRKFNLLILMAFKFKYNFLHFRSFS